jgi:hypothetical protein
LHFPPATTSSSSPSIVSAAAAVPQLYNGHMSNLSDGEFLLFNIYF